MCDGSYQHSVGDGAGLLSSIPAGSQYTREEETPVIHARLNTLRIMKGDQTTLTIKHVPSGQEILLSSVTQYLLLSKIHSHTGDEMGDQEYLDRQDSYTLLFFIQSSDMGIPKICPRIMVNGWTVRLNDSELEF